MEKESVKKFDLEAAFKALDEIEIPQTKGIKANRADLKERFGHKPATETLVEDYYDVSSNEDLKDAKEERDGEVAKAKLARIEKIVDLNAESPEDLLPSYVGKVIMQCPQCMTLFYKNQEDIEPSEENPDIVNLNEPCQHCGNTSGYTLIGKVGAVSEDEADKYDETSAEENENELNLDFDKGTEEVDAEGTGEGAKEMSDEETKEESSDEASSDDDLDLDLNLDEVPEEEPEEEKKEESLKEGLDINTYRVVLADYDSDDFDINVEFGLQDEEENDVADQEWLLKPGQTKGDLVVYLSYECAYTSIYVHDERPATADEIKTISGFDTVPGITDWENYGSIDEGLKEAKKDEEEHKSENLTLNEEIDKDLDEKLKAHNDYIAYLQQMIKQEEEALKKAENDEIKAAIQRRLDAFTADLEAALPDAVKAETPVEEIAEEPVEEETKTEEEKVEEPVEEGYKGTPEERTTHLEYTDDDPTDGKAVIPNNIEKQLTETSVRAMRDTWTIEESSILKYYPNKHQVEDYINKAKAVELAEAAKGNTVRVIIYEKFNRIPNDGPYFQKMGHPVKICYDSIENPEVVKIFVQNNLMLEEGLDEAKSISGRVNYNAEGEDFAEGYILKVERNSIDYRPRFTYSINTYKKEIERLNNYFKSHFDRSRGKTLTAIENEKTAEEKAEKEAPVDEALTEETKECKVVLSDKPEKEVFTGTKEECEKIIEKNKETKTAKEHGLKIVEPAADENKVEEKSEKQALKEGVESEIDSIIASWGVKESLTEEGDLDRLLDSDEFKTPVSEEEIDAARREVAKENLEEKCGKQKITEESDSEIATIINSWKDAPEAPVEEACEGKECDDCLKEEKEDEAEIEETDNSESSEGVCFTAKEVKEVATDVAQSLATPAEDEEEAEKQAEEIADVVDEKVDKAIEEKAENADKDDDEESAEEDESDEEDESGDEESEEAEIEESEFNEDDIDELDECSLNKHIDEYLKEVYSNVKSYETTGCELKEGKLIVEGKISFNSGKEKLTMFEFLPAYCEGKLFFEGYNKDFSEDKAFKLNCSINESKTLITESFGYKYKINENLVEGLK